MNLLGAQGGGQWRKTSRDREMSEGRWVRAGWKAEGGGREWNGKAGPRGRREQWALSVASQACPEGRGGVSREQRCEGGAPVGLGKKQEASPLQGKTATEALSWECA